jgi:ATP-dependent Clp protease ATP-binding subunit ClpA
MTPPPPTLQELIDIVRQDAGSAESLDLLVTAASAVAQLEETGDALLGHFVDRCRRDGNSWSQISQALGVTKQAVHKRFAVAADQLIAGNPAPTLERFTDRARRVLAAAVREAAPAAASSAHLLLAQFAQPEGLAARALEELGITEASVRAATEAARSPADASAEPGQPASPAQQSDQSASQPKFTQDGHHLLRDAVAVALELGHNYIGTEHLLLASYRHRDGEAAKVLRALGATETATTDLVTGMLAGPRPTP